MLNKKISHGVWDESLCAGMVDFLNYYSLGGPLKEITDRPKPLQTVLKRLISLEEVARYRQLLGGAFTSHEELWQIPGFNEDLLEQLAFQVSGLDLYKLKTLAPQTVQNNHIDVYVNGPDCLKMILEEIAKAQRYIHLSVMLFYSDQSGHRIVQALIDALARGVRVRVMVDYEVTSIGYDHNREFGDFEGMAKRLQAAGGETINTFHKCYSDLNWVEKRAELEIRGVSESILYLQDLVQKKVITGLNVMNHRKFMIIDGFTSMVGSLNFGDQYLFNEPLRNDGHVQEVDGRQLGVPSKEGRWHDGCFRIQGAVALALNELFASQWFVLGGSLFDVRDDFYYPDMDRNCGDERCTLFICFPGNPVNLIQQYYISLVSRATDETIIINPYLIDQVFWDKLKEAEAESVCHVSICNPLEVNDHPTNKAAVLSNMYTPFQNGVSFYDYSQTGRFSHWKIVYDKRSDCIFHGSFNLNERSACHDFELGLLVKSKPFADKVKALIDYDLGVSFKITDGGAFYKYPNLHPSNYLNEMTKYFS